MKKAFLSAVLTLLAAPLCAVATEPPTNPKAMFTVYNGTGGAARYEVRWGDGPWRQYALPAGAGHYRHECPLSADGEAPSSHVRFVIVTPDGRQTTMASPVKSTMAGAGFNPEGDWARARRYRFAISPDGKSIDLKPW